MKVSILEQILDILFPARCVGCGRFGGYLCKICFGKIQFAKRQFCPVCGKAAIGGFTHPGCKTPLSLDCLLSVAEYTGVIHPLISHFKYKPFITSLQEVIRQIITVYFSSEENHFTEKFLVTAVPLHWMRKNWRGYNQAEILGSIVAKIFDFEFSPKILRRTRFTKPQTQLKRKERLENVRGTFALEKNAREKIQGKSILLIDDVWTTGSTLKECAKILKRNGTKTVWALTLTRGVKKAKQNQG